MAVQYQLTQGPNGRKTLIVFVPYNGTHVFQEDHPRFDAVLDECENSGDDLTSYAKIGQHANISAIVEDQFLTTSVEIVNGKVTLSGERVDPVIEKEIINAVREDDEVTWAGLSLFLESLDRNPSFNSREQLYGFLRKHGLTINGDGTFQAFKGVQQYSNGDGAPRRRFSSLNGGRAFVNGLEHESGPVPQDVNDVVTLDRRDVDDDPNSPCSTGLHVGSLAYATGFGPITLEVSVRPEDVVSVPSDSDEQKVRTCQYQVVGVLDEDPVGIYR